MESKFLDIVQKRRSYRVITNQSSIGEEAITEIIQKALEHTPTAFNSQSPRIALLFGQRHRNYWESLIEKIKQKQSIEQFEKSYPKLLAHQEAFGTILFFEDIDTHNELKAKFPKLVDDVEKWADQGQGMIQYIVWASLSEQGLGASLQHTLIKDQEELLLKLNIPTSWKLYAQMPYGIPLEEPRSKQFVDVSTRLKVLK